MTNSQAPLGQHLELQAFMAATGFSPVAVRGVILDELDELFKDDPLRAKVRETLEGTHTLQTIEARTGGSFADHVAFRRLMTSDDAEAGYLAYMRIWLAGEMFFFHPEHYYRLPYNFQRTEYP